MAGPHVSTGARLELFLPQWRNDHLIALAVPGTGIWIHGHRVRGPLLCQILFLIAFTALH